jgi:regulator of sirC expression with transglutaminase-like and TPR domain
MLQPKHIQAFSHAALSPDPDLAIAALMIARVENPALDSGPYLDQLDALGREAAKRVAALPELHRRIAALNDYLFRELGFAGNEVEYEDPRNSFLNEVLDRRLGIPITLALVYMEVARRADVSVVGVNFPGRFLLRSQDLIIDPFGGGTLLSEEACRDLLRHHAGEEATWDAHLLARATKPQILVRMLLNLKRIYVAMHSFPQARDITELLLAVDPMASHELRDRGLLAYNLRDFSAALRDLQAYLSLSSVGSADGEARDEQAQIWERVKMLRRRVASFN